MNVLHDHCLSGLREEGFLLFNSRWRLCFILSYDRNSLSRVCGS